MAKSKKDIMHVREYINRFNELSLILHCSGKDPMTRKNKVFVKTVKVPAELTGKKEIEAFRLKAQMDWKDEVQKHSSGATVQKNNILFINFAKEYVENIIFYNKQAYNYYRTSRDYLKVIEEKLSAYLLHEMTPIVIQKFCKWLCERTYQKLTVTVKQSLSEIMTNKKISIRSVAQDCNMAHTTLLVALEIGKTISKETATKLCKFFEVPIDKYFDITKKEVPYSWSANNGIKVLIHGILHEAVRQRLIEHNYASKDYIRPVTGTKGKREILDNIEDIQTFIKCIETESDIRKRVAFSCYIYLGLRNAEVAGLAWSAIDFENNEISIEQNTIYVGGFGTVSKDPKSNKSKRVISVPTALMNLLKDYKIWWDIEKENHGDLWATTDKLFVQNLGNDMNGMTLANWLKEFQEKHGLKKVSPHGLRHSNITMLISNGVDVKTVSARVGHADIQTTLNIYSHYTSQADKQAANKIDELLKI